MNPIIDLAAISKFLLPGALGIIGNYDLYHNEWKRLYTTVPSYKNTEVYIEYMTLNAAGRFGDGSSIPLGQMQTVFQTNAQNYTSGVGFVITKNAIDDNLYADQFPQSILAIRENLQVFQEYDAVAGFDNAFNANGNPDFIYGDGQPLCSSVHPYAQGALSNVITPSQLGLTSYQALITLVQQFRDYSGKPIMISPQHLYIGIPNQFEAAVITGSQYDPTGMSNRINPLLEDGYINGKFVLSHYMSNPYQFFLMTAYRDGAIYQMRQPLLIEMMTDQSNRNLAIYGSLRYRYTFPNWRCVAGSQGF